MKTAKSALLISLCVLSSFAADASDFPQWKIADGLELALSLFGDIRVAYGKLVVDPLVRVQSLHSLRVLSNRLEDLALAKQEFTEELLAAKWPGDQPRLAQSASNLREEVWRSRRALSKVFEPLPDNLKARSGEVQRKLEGGLSLKWKNLKELSSELQLPEPSAEAFRRESKTMLDTIAQMRVVVDQLIAEIAQGQ